MLTASIAHYLSLFRKWRRILKLYCLLKQQSYLTLWFSKTYEILCSKVCWKRSCFSLLEFPRGHQCVSWIIVFLLHCLRNFPSRNSSQSLIQSLTARELFRNTNHNNHFLHWSRLCVSLLSTLWVFSFKIFSSFKASLYPIDTRMCWYLISLDRFHR